MFIFCRLTCPEPYFLSEGLYATPEELENTREITLHVITIGAFIEDSTKVSTTKLEKYRFSCKSQRSVNFFRRDLFHLSSSVYDKCFIRYIIILKI